VSGGDDTGYRVVLSFPAEAGAGSFAVYVVRENGDYRIAGLSTADSMLGEEALRHLQRGDAAGAGRWLDWAHADLGSDAGGADPVPPRPFAVLWPPRAAGDAGEIRCAAATLLAEKESARALPLLRPCRDAAGDPARRNALDLALALAAAAAGRYAEMEEASGRLLAAAPGSERAERLQAQALTALGRWDDLRALGRRRLERSADHVWARELLAREAVHAGDFGRAETELRQVVKAGKATANDLNELAWLLLQRGQVDDEALDFGQRAATLSDYKQWPILHTLACLYAEKGRTAEAYRIIVQSLGAKPDETPGPDDWYVFGRLAEQYGLPDVARKYYKKVQPPKSLDAEPISTYALASRRLTALGDEKKNPRRVAL
jgi:tetratricopeptide (TPR) repeat protein